MDRSCLGRGRGTAGERGQGKERVSSDSRLASGGAVTAFVPHVRLACKRMVQGVTVVRRPRRAAFQCAAFVAFQRGYGPVRRFEKLPGPSSHRRLAPSTTAGSWKAGRLGEERGQ